MLLTLLAVVVVLVLAVAGIQRKLIYFPDAWDPGQVAERGVDGDDVVLRTEDGLELAAWLLHPTGPDRDAAVLYLHGNGGNRLGRLELGEELAARGFTVLLVDYRGYGGNPGSPSEDGLARDARAAAAFLRDAGIPAERTIVLGESIGSGVASRLATTDPPAGLFLRSPFTSLADAAAATYPRPLVELVLQDRYPSDELLATSDVPVLITHGDADDVVPGDLSADLATRVGNLHDVVLVPGAGHNDEVWFGPFVADLLAGFADDVLPAG